VLTCGWRAVQLDTFFSLEAHPKAADLYVQDMYFIMTTMSTVGFGDIFPTDTGQRLYAIFSMTIAPLIFGAVVSVLSRATEGLFNDTIAAKMAQTTRFMRQRGVPSELAHRVIHNLRCNAMQERQMMLAPDVLIQLSPAVQRELLSELLRGTVLQFPLFKGANSAFVGELAQAHNWVYCFPGDIVVEEGQIEKEIVFIVRGKLVMMPISKRFSGGSATPECVYPSDESGPDDDLEQGTTLRPGAWFGEVCLFEEERVRDCNVIAMVEAELAVLEAEDYHRIVGKYPRVMARHQHIASRMKARTLELDALAYIPPRVSEDGTGRRSRLLQVLPRMSWYDTSVPASAWGK
jgi:CRP-like cAMP-binding protein